MSVFIYICWVCFCTKSCCSDIELWFLSQFTCYGGSKRRDNFVYILRYTDKTRIADAHNFRRSIVILGITIIMDEM